MDKRKRMKWVSLFLAMTVMLGGCKEDAKTVMADADGSAPAVAVKAVNAELGTLTISNEFIGTVSPLQQVSVVPLVSGEVDEVYFEVGDEVQAGDILFHIKDDAARLQAESAQLQKQSVANAAKSQLGTANVMGNMQIASNIRSIQYQIDMTRDQYNQASDGIADAREAKQKMEDALNEINSSINSLERSQKSRESVISEAGKYLDPTTADGWQNPYPYSLKPDEYDWSEPNPEQDPVIPVIPEQPADNTTSDEAEAPADNTTFDEAETPADKTASDEAKEDADVTASDEAEDEADVTASEEPGEAAEPTTAEPAAKKPAGAEEPGNESGKTDSTDDDSADTEAEAADTAGLTSFYFANETVRSEKEPRPEGYFTTEDKAWEAYNRQQKINSVKKQVSDMGYSAKDIASGKAVKDMAEDAVQIVALQYQASQIQSSQGQLDSSIKTAEAGKKTAEKAIDFYNGNIEDIMDTYEMQNGQVYQETYDTLATQLQTADVGVRSAQLQLEFYSPASPISGTVISKGVELYGLAQPGYPAYVISNQDAMTVTFSVSGQVRNNLTIGEAVTIEKDGNTYPGTITEIGESVNPQAGALFTVKAVTEAGGGVLLSGSAVRLTVDTFRSENTVLIPYDAVHFESEQAYVYVIKDGKAVLTKVTAGLMNEDTVEITEGLKMNERIVSTWSAQLEDGTPVRIIGEDNK